MYVCMFTINDLYCIITQLLLIKYKSLIQNVSYHIEMCMQEWSSNMAGLSHVSHVTD